MTDPSVLRLPASVTGRVRSPPRACEDERRGLHTAGPKNRAQRTASVPGGAHQHVYPQLLGGKKTRTEALFLHGEKRV